MIAYHFASAIRNQVQWPIFRGTRRTVRVNVCVYIAGAIRAYVTRERKMSCKLSVFLTSKEMLIGERKRNWSDGM